jgi:4-amino-4-deoxy-L-arabinose transferase-like glycosyltransferase
VSTPAEARAPHGRGWLAWLAAVFVAALVPRLIYSAQFERSHPQAQRLAIDEAAYDRWARELASGDWVGREIFFQEPLYAYSLGIVYSLAGDEPAAQRSLARTLQAILGAATAVLVALLTARVVSRKAGLVAGFALALYRPAIWMGALLLKPALFLPLITTFAIALISTRGLESARAGARLARWLLVGLLAGIGALLRGNMLILSPLFIAWPVARALAQHKKPAPALGSSAAVLLGIALVLLPVALRNRAVGGRLVLTTSGAGTNVYGGNNPHNPYGLATEFPWVRGVPEHEAGDWRHEAERRLGRTLDPSQVSRYWLGQAVDSALAEPGLHLSILWNKLRLTLGAYEVPDNHFIEWDARYVPFLRLPWPGFGVVGSVGLAGLLLVIARSLGKRAQRDPAALELAALFALYLGTIVLTVTSERVRLALVPLLLPFGALWVLSLRRSVRELALPLTCLAVAALFVLVPTLPVAKRQSDFDERDHNLAVGLLTDPVDLDGAAQLASALERRHPADPRVLVLCADVEYRLARRALDDPGLDDPARARAGEGVLRALARLQRAAASEKPIERFQADALCGAILQYLGRWAEAEERYRAALHFDPADRDLRRRLAVAIAERAVIAPEPAARRSGLEEALQIVRALLAEQADPELADLAERFDQALNG